MAIFRISKVSVSSQRGLLVPGLERLMTRLTVSYSSTVLVIKRTHDSDIPGNTCVDTRLINRLQICWCNKWETKESSMSSLHQVSVHGHAE